MTTNPRYVRACSWNAYSTDVMPEDWQTMLCIDQPFASITDCYYWRTEFAPMPHFAARMTRVMLPSGDVFIVDCDPVTFLALIACETIDIPRAERIYENTETA